MVVDNLCIKLSTWVDLRVRDPHPHAKYSQRICEQSVWNIYNMSGRYVAYDFVGVVSLW